tara:strand:- start:904 stop:1578 length:675 start_codon:yes stop_codon:yes gene_type:complete
MKKKSIFLWFLLFIFLTTYNFDFEEGPINSFFTIKKIEVNGIQNANPSVIQERLDIFHGKNIIILDSKQLIKTIAGVDFVKDIKIKKIYPDKIKIIINEYNPVGIFVDNKEKYILFENGKIIKNYNKKFESLPLVHGKNANKNFKLFYKSLKESNLETKIVDYFRYHESNRWDIFLKDGKLIKLPSEHDRNTESIKKFLSIYKKESFKKFKVFDFRVKNQIIMK